MDTITGKQLANLTGVLTTWIVDGTPGHEQRDRLLALEERAHGNTVTQLTNLILKASRRRSTPS